MRFLRKHRLILVLYAVAVALGSLEIAGRPATPEATSTDASGLPPDAALILELYPHSPEADHVRGVQAQYLRFDLQEARRCFEKALATGIKSNSNLLYDYAVVLYLMQAEAGEVDAAIARWMRNDPASTLPPPRSLHREFPEWQKAGSLKVMALSPNGRVFAMVLPTGEIAFIDLPVGRRSSITPTETPSIDHLLGFSRDGYLLAGADSNGHVQILDVRESSIGSQLKGSKSAAVLSAEFSPDKNTCAIGRSEGGIQLWSLRTSSVESVLTGHNHPVSALAFSGNGHRLASGCRSGSIRLWDLNAVDQQPFVLPNCSAVVAGLAFSPDNKKLASATRDGLVRIWDVDSGSCSHVLVGHSAPVSCVAFSADGQLLASGSADRTVRFWDTSSGREIRTRLIVCEDGVCSVAFSEDGARLVTVDFNGSVHPILVPQSYRP